jgi:hypothetical protein
MSAAWSGRAATTLRLESLGRPQAALLPSEDLGRIYEDRQTLPDLRWFWSITVYVDPKLGIKTSGRAASLDEAKGPFLSNWQRCCADSTPSAHRST